MANKNIFKSVSGKKAVPVANTTNLAGGMAYSMSDKHALAQFACTGTFGNTFYADAASQLEKIKELVNKVDPKFIADLAVYSRQSAYMKDMPAYLLAVLANKDIELFKSTFPKVMDNGKMVRNFVQIIRSGVTGRKSLGSAPKRAISNWIASRKDSQLFNDSVGNDPSLSDVIKMVHPTPETKSRKAFYGYLTGRKHDASLLPDIVREFEAFKTAVAEKAENRKTPNVNFQMLTALPLSEADWESIAKNAKWQMTRMNLNTFARHGVYSKPENVKMIAERLRNASFIENAKVFPYQLFTAYLNTVGGSDVPETITNALQDAMETAIKNVPRLDGKIFVGVDISGSMNDSITGYRTGGVSSKTSCRQVAALLASAIKRKNDETEIYTFDTVAREIRLNGRDSVMTNAQKIATPGGGTDCSSFIKLLNDQKSKGDLVVVVSDNESWADRANFYGRTGSTGLMHEWSIFKSRNPKAKLVCIDLTPNTTTQAPDSKDRLNVGGFSDNVFTVISNFLTENGSPEYWVSKIEKFEPVASNTTETESDKD